MDIEKPRKVVREIVTNVEDEEDSVVEERNKLERAVMNKLASPCLEQLTAALQENRSLATSKLMMSLRKSLTVFLLFLRIFLVTCDNCVYMCTSNGRFKREVWEDVQVQLAQLALFRYSPNHPQAHFVTTNQTL